MSRFGFWIRLPVFAGALLYAVLSGMPAAAQVATPSPQELNPGERLPAPEAGTTGNKGDLLAPPPEGPCPLNDIPFKLNSVRFAVAEGKNGERRLTAGDPSVNVNDLAPAYADLVGARTSVRSICLIRDRASRILFNKGILARVEIPPQDVTDGNLKLLVIEAYIAGIDVHGDVGPVRGKVAQYIEMLRGMKPFDINKAQRYLFLASDVPGVHIAATLKPNTQGRGAITLDIKVTRDNWDALLNIQNLGSREVGPFGALARVDFNSNTRLGDRTSLVAYSTFQNEQQVYQAIEEIRPGSSGLMASFSASYGETRPGGPLSVLDLRGRSLVLEASVLYPIKRSRYENLNLVGGFEFVNQDVDVAGNTALTRDQLRVFSLMARGDIVWHDFLPGSAAMDVEVRKGIGGHPTFYPLASRVEGKADAFEFRSAGELQLGLAPYISVGARYSGQYADDPLLAYEELPVGNLTIGRGYDPSIISGDRGIEGSLELHVGNFGTPLSRLTIGFMGFYDVAAIENLDSGGLNRTLHSAGGGLTLLVGNAHIDVTYAHPFDKPSPLAPALPSDSVLMSVTVNW